MNFPVVLCKDLRKGGSGGETQGGDGARGRTELGGACSPSSEPSFEPSSSKLSSESSSKSSSESSSEPSSETSLSEPSCELASKSLSGPADPSPLSASLLPPSELKLTGMGSDLGTEDEDEAWADGRSDMADVEDGGGQGPGEGLAEGRVKGLEGIGRATVRVSDGEKDERGWGSG